MTEDLRKVMELYRSLFDALLTSTQQLSLQAIDVHERRIELAMVIRKMSSTKILWCRRQRVFPKYLQIQRYRACILELLVKPASSVGSDQAPQRCRMK